MALREEFEQQGTWLFRWRSYLPMLVFIPASVAIFDPTYIHGVQSDSIGTNYKIACFLISALGLFIRCLAIGFAPMGTSGRNVKAQNAQTINTTGIYSVVRHPLYLGNFFMYLGIALYVQVWWFHAFFILAFWIYYERIMFAEEEFLRRNFGDQFTSWATKTPAFIPRLIQWKKPALTFSFKNVLRREYPGVLACIASFVVMDVGSRAVALHRFSMSRPWIITLGIGILFYLIVRFLRARTNLLAADGR